MVEGVERVVSVDLELEAVAGSRVEYGDSDAARRLLPEQVDVDCVAGAVRQLGSPGDRCRGHCPPSFRPNAGGTHRLNDEWPRRKGTVHIRPVGTEARRAAQCGPFSATVMFRV